VLRPELAAALGAERFLQEIRISRSSLCTTIRSMRDSWRRYGRWERWGGDRENP